MNYKYKVLGVRLLDFCNDQGEKIHGYQLWVCGQTSDRSWLGGIEVFKVWIAIDSPMAAQVAQLRTGDQITGECDRRGRPISIVKA